MNNAFPEWACGSTLYEVNLRQFTPGGTMKEFREHLPRLKALGVNILWFMPLQPIGLLNRKGTVGSVYSIRDYCRIDQLYGDFNEFESLVKEIHSMGMHVILDWVANHTAWDHEWVSLHPDFYRRNEKNEVFPPFPEWSDVIGLDYTNADLRKAMIDSMIFWLKTGIDGFRCDMAHLVPTDFWEQARTELQKHKKNIFMLAETDQVELLDKAFHACYDWKIYHEMNQLMKGNQNVQGLRTMIEDQLAFFPKQQSLMRFTSNHDENSWEGSELERLALGLEACTVLYFTLPGMPLVYSGQEAGNNRRMAFFDKDCIEWKPDKMFGLYQTLIQLKKEVPALWAGPWGGDFTWIETESQDSVLAFSRKKSISEVFVALNLTNAPAGFQLPAGMRSSIYLDVLNDCLPIGPDSSSGITLEPWGYRLFRSM
jgi:glycosidase